MNDLPVPTASNDQQIQDAQPVSVSPGGKEGGSFKVDTAIELPLQPVGKEVELPKEVEQAGVFVHETVVQLPEQVTEQGVVSVKHNVSTVPTSGASITLPLTDDQIELALKEHVELSIRWLAEWCTYQMKKMQSKLYSQHN